MTTFLNNHPFAVEAWFDSSLVITFAAAKEELQPLLPGCLQLDTLHDKWAFVAAAMVDTKRLRPKGFPVWLGNDFFLAGYRVFVRYTTNAGKNLRGLYILKSNTNKKKMQILGDLFTHYHYSTIDISLKSIATTYEVKSQKGDINILVDTLPATELPAGSPFNDWQEARRFAGPLPFTFSFDSTKNRVLIVKGVRKDWHPSPVTVLRHHVGYVQHLHLKSLRLASAFIIRNVPYHWEKGKTEIWQRQESPSQA
jgi:hypothetical protein